MFWTCPAISNSFHISHITGGTIWELFIVEAVDNAVTKYVRLWCDYATLNLNEPIKVAHLEKLANQSVFNSALVIEKWSTNPSSETKKKNTFVVW